MKNRLQESCLVRRQFLLSGLSLILFVQAMRVQTEMELRMFQQNEFMYYKMREAALQNQKIQIMPEPTNEVPPGIFQKKQ